MSIATEISRIKSAKNSLKTAINGKGGTLTDETVDDYAAAVSALQVHDLSAVTAAASDILAGKVAVDRSGERITGNIQTVEAVRTDNVVTVPAGYIASAQTLTVPVAEAPEVSGNTVTIRSGYAASGRTVVVGTAKTAETFIPGTADQTISADTYLTGEQTVKGDAKLVSGNIRAGVAIFGVSGSYSGADVSGVTAAAGDVTAGTKFVDPAGVLTDGTLPVVAQPIPTVSLDRSTGVVTASYTPLAGRVKETAAKSETLQLDVRTGDTITPGNSAVTAVDAGKYTTGNVIVAGDANLASENIVSGVTIFGVQGSASASGIDTSDATAAAGDMLQGKTAYVNGVKITGGIPTVAASCDGTTVTVPAGYIASARSFPVNGGGMDELEFFDWMTILD